MGLVRSRWRGNLIPLPLSGRIVRSQFDTGTVSLDPYEPAMIQPSSIDLRLDKYFRVFIYHKYTATDSSVEPSESTRLIEVEPGGPLMLHPGEFVIGSTYESVALPDGIAAQLEGRPSSAAPGC